MKRSSVHGLLAPLVATLALAACRRPAVEEAPAAPESIPVRVALVAKEDVAHTVRAVGELAPPPGQDVKLGSTMAGWLAELHVAEGDHVVAGQLLARLDATAVRDLVTQAEATLAQSRAQEENAKTRLARTARLFDAGIASKQEVEDGRAQAAATAAAVHSSQAGLSTARHQLGRTELRATIPGIVARVFVAAGEPLDGSGRPLLEITRTRQLELRAPVAASQAALVRPGQGAQVTVDGFAGRSFPGRVSAIAPIVDPATGAVLVRVRVDNDDGLLRGGAFGTAVIVTDVHHGVPSVPRDALLPDDSTPFEDAAGVLHLSVVVVGVDARAHRRPVLLGYVDADRAEILAGAAPGERVVVRGGYALPDGTPVAVESAASQDQAPGSVR